MKKEESKGGKGGKGWIGQEGVRAGSRLPFRTAEVVSGKKMAHLPTTLNLR